MPTLCIDTAVASKAISIIQRDWFSLFIDCEGRDLGSAGGKLSLLSVGTPRDKQIYVFDVLNLSSQTLQPLFNILAGTNVLKIVWSGRMDFSELFFGHGVELRNVLDLQIVDVSSRSLRYPNPFLRVARLSTGGVKPSQIKKLQHQDIYDLCGMDQALREHGITAGMQIPKSGLYHFACLSLPCQCIVCFQPLLPRCTRMVRVRNG